MYVLGLISIVIVGIGLIFAMIKLDLIETLCECVVDIIELFFD